MRLYVEPLTVAIVAGVVIFAGFFSKEFFGHDNPLEETGEAILQETTGIKMDFSEGTPDDVWHDHTDEECPYK